MASTPELWHLQRDDREHVLEIADAGLGRRLTWRIDGTEVSSRKTSEERVVLTAPDASEDGAIGVRLPMWSGPARRVTLYDDELAAHAGVGGVDLDPEPGSKAAAREAWIREHPHLHTFKHTTYAVIGVAVPLLVLWLLARFALPAIPWPDLGLPSIPWPDLPSIPWPDLGWPWFSLPEVPQQVKDAAKFVGPVLLAFAIARGEVRRRRTQDENKQAAKDDDDSPSDPTQ